jgi:hypothetical protein
MTPSVQVGTILIGQESPRMASTILPPSRRRKFTPSNTMGLLFRFPVVLNRKASLSPCSIMSVASVWKSDKVLR